MAVLLVAAGLLWVGAGPAAADVATFSNTASIAVPATGSADQIGPGSPYPSTISVTGMSGNVTDVNITLNTVNHAIATDMDILLVGPAGQNLVVMSDAKSGTGFPITNANLTFDDQAAGTIPGTGVLNTGAFQPTNVNDGPDTFPAPAPAPSTATALSVFNGTNPNGTWSLYTVDDATGDIGSIGGGWSITINTAAIAQPGNIQFTSSTFRGAEGGGPVALTLQRMAGSDGAVSVTVATTTPATATAGIDFTPLNQTVSFADGQTTASIPLTILNDTAVEGVDETVTVALSNPTGGAALGTPNTTVVRIDDNDATFDTSPITIPGIGTGGPTGAPANPYPASIHVSGAPALIGGVEITLDGFSHAIPEDVDILLVGPGGQNVVLMSDVGGGLNPVSNLDLKFSDSGSGTIPALGPIVSGTYRPSDNDPGGDVDSFPAPAPAPSTATSLAAFVATNPNGVWNLFIVDDASGDTGSISGGWSLTFLPAVFPDAGGPYAVGEGLPVTLDGSATVTPAGSTFAWDVDNDGAFDDATGQNPTVSAATLASLGLGDGPAGPVTVTLQVTSGTTIRTDTTTLTVANTAPTASVGTVPAGIVAGTPATFTFGATNPSTADTAAGFTYAINWGDGTPVQSVTGGASVNVSHTYAADGTFTVSVTATDKDGGTSATTTASVGVAAIVVADAGGPYTVGEGLPVTLDGSGTVAPGTATFEWDVDGDGQFDDATGQTPTIPAASLATLGLGDGPDSVDVGLQVTAGTQVSADTATLTITNTPPTASIDDVPALIVAQATATFTFGATDLSAEDTAAGFGYTIDWGDGSTTAESGGPALAVGHTYAAAGTFTISVTVTDKDGGAGTTSASVVALDEVIANAGGPYTVGEGEPLSLDGSGSAAPDDATFNWDIERDGIIDATGRTPTISAAYLQSISLGDGPAGPIQVTLQVLSGAQASVHSTTLTITNTAPTASVSAPSGLVAGTPANFTFGATDPSAADTAAGFTYVINWGDGSADQTVPNGAATLPLAHTYPEAGQFTLSVTATDKDGGESAQESAQVLVVPDVDAGGPYTAGEGRPVTLDGSATIAAPGAQFAWDVDGDGAFDDATGESPTISVQTLADLGLGDGLVPPANVTVGLQVTVGAAVGTATSTLTITNTAPTAVTDVPAGLMATSPATFTFGATDPSAADTAAGFSYAIDWGDGSAVQAVTGGTGVEVDHTYAAVGTFTISVTATDKDGGVSPAATAVASVGPLVEADAGGIQARYAITEGEDLALDGTATTAGPTAVYEWDLDGDGDFSDATGPAPVLTPEDLAVFGLDDGPQGPLTITLRVTEGPSVDTATATYEITNEAPVATVDMSGPIVAGTPTTVKVGAEDPSPTDMAGQFEYRVDWEGDGVVDDVVAGPADPPVTHTYASQGEVGFTVVAVDKDGAASEPTVVEFTVHPAESDNGEDNEGADDGEMADTGADLATPALAALGLLLVGTVLVGVARQRRR